jgi:hypothetical protein
LVYPEMDPTGIEVTFTGFDSQFNEVSTTFEYG